MTTKIKTMTLAGLCLSLFGHLLVSIILKLSPLSNALSEQNSTVLGLILIWLIVILLLVIIKKGEKRTFSSIGYQSITGKDILTAVGIGVILSLTVPLLTLLFSQLIPSNSGGIEEVTATTPWWLMFVGILTAGITEEIIFRGYIIERVEEITKKTWVAILVSIIAFVLSHLMSWNLAHVIAVVLPLGLILSGLYILKRNLLFNIIVHIVIDLPLVFMALMAN